MAETTSGSAPFRTRTASILQVKNRTLRHLFTVALICKATVSVGQSGVDETLLADAMELWEQDYHQLDIQPLALGYRQVMRDIIDTNDRSDQRQFFSKIQGMLAAIDVQNLSTSSRLEFEIMNYESQLHIEKLDLVDQLSTYTEITDEGVYHQTLGPDWYLYLVRRWTGTRLDPEEIQQYGIKEARRIKRAMKKIRIAYDSTQFTLHPDTVEAAFARYEQTLIEPLAQHFPDFPALPPLTVSRGTNEALAQVPGYYGSNRLSYNLFDHPFDLSQIPWLYLHEGNPGHHFQLNYEDSRPVPRYREQRSYSGFREGWAAYVEEVAHELHLYPSDAATLSQMNWDLIRSVRLILDVGINYEGWTNEEALEHWQRYIEDKDEIGQREIQRMRRWPAQVLTYKIGARGIMEAREQIRNELGSRFSMKEFHTLLLSQRSIPVMLLRYLNPQMLNKDQ